MGSTMGRVDPTLLAALERLGASVAEETNRRARREAGIAERRERGCSVRRQQDEYVCSTCGVRWDQDEEVSCPRR